MTDQRKLSIEEIRRLLRGELGDGKAVEAVTAQLRTAGKEAAALIRARLGDDVEARAAADEAWHEIETELPTPKPLDEPARDRLGVALRKLNAFLEEAVERSSDCSNEDRTAPDV